MQNSARPHCDASELSSSKLLKQLHNAVKTKFYYCVLRSLTAAVCSLLCSVSEPLCERAERSGQAWAVDVTDKERLFCWKTKLASSPSTHSTTVLTKRAEPRRTNRCSSSQCCSLCLSDRRCLKSLKMNLSVKFCPRTRATNCILQFALFYF